MTDPIETLLEKYKRAYPNLDYAAAVFRHHEPMKAARISAEGILDEIVADLQAVVDDAADDLTASLIKRLRLERDHANDHADAAISENVRLRKALDGILEYTADLNPLQGCEDRDHEAVKTARSTLKGSTP